jgi:hypothetical protein
LLEKGYQFDYISDAQLQQTRADKGELATPGARYKVLVVPATRRMPVATLQKIATLAKEGARVIFQKLPEDVPGHGRLEERRAQFKQALAQLGDRGVASDSVSAVGRHAVREPIADTGISFIRRATAAGSHDYFLANLSAKAFDGWVKLGSSAANVSLLDPLSGDVGRAQQSSNGIRLQLAPGASLRVRAATSSTNMPAWPYREPAGASVALNGKWAVTFLKGGPELPPAIETTALKSWTDLGGDEAKRFAGTARYRIEFEAPAEKADDWLLNLGDVRETARVRLHGEEIGIVWSLPFQIRLGRPLKPGRNVLELDVTNLAANRIRDMDRRKVDWKIMREINFVNINYKPFDASEWAIMPSGLLGPVTLTPLRPVKR